MTSALTTNGSSSQRCQYDAACDKETTKNCSGCGQTYCTDHLIAHQTKLQNTFQSILRQQYSVNQKLKAMVSKLPLDVALTLVEQIYEFKIKSNDIEERADRIQDKLEHLTDENFKSKRRNGSKTHQKNSLEKEIESLREDVGQLKDKLEELSEESQKKQPSEETSIHNERMKSLPVPHLNVDNKARSQSTIEIPGKNSNKQAEENKGVSNLLLRLMSPSIIDLQGNQLGLSEEDSKALEEREENILSVIGSDTSSRSSRKIHLSNNIVSWLKGPFRVLVDGTMHLVEVFAQDTPVSDDVVEAVKKGLVRSTEIVIEQSTNGPPIKPAYAEITADWTVEGENPDRGFSSASIWLRDPQNEHILAKTQDHPMCAANEWLAYILGRHLDLAVNEVQIAIYEEKLVSLHTDVTRENEKTITFMDLPKQMRKLLLTDPTIESMDLFDHIIDNVDRNPRNILITMPKTADLEDENTKLKIHLIDHSSSFGMGKLNAISIFACKLHSQHLAVVKFDPVEKAKKFEQYLSKLPVADRILIRKTLNRFAAINNEQFDTWLNEIQDLLTSTQYERIRDVLYRQRDIAKRYTVQWGISPRSSNGKLNELNSTNSNTNGKLSETTSTDNDANDKVNFF